MLSSLMITFEWNGSQVLERVLGCESAKRLLRTFQKSREIIHNNKFLSKCSKERRGGISVIRTY